MAELQTISTAGTTQQLMDKSDKAIRATANRSAPSTISGGTVFSDATKGLSLNTDNALTLTDKYDKGGFEYQNESSSPYDVAGPSPAQLSFDVALKNDTTGRLIGAAPKVEKKAEAPKAPAFGMQVTGQVSQEAGNTLQALENTAINDYQNDLAYWQSQGKFWFDPNSEIKPDLDKYLDNMPSAVNALRGSGMNALQKGETDSFGEGAYNILLNPAAGNHNNKAVSYVLNPLSALDKKAGSGFAGYVGSQAAKGAMGGMAGGGIGAGVGAVIGVVKGIFTWFSAKGEDANNLKQAQQKYELELQDWTIKRNKRQIAEKEADFRNRQIAEAEYTIVEDNKKDKAEAKKLQRVSQGRAVMKNVLMNSGKSGQAYRDRRASAKATRRV